MPARPARTRATLALVALGLLACESRDPAPPVREVIAPSVYVVPTVGSGGNGFGAGSNSPAAQAPNGLVKVGPDTSGPFGLTSFLHFSGYWFGDDRIRGFSHVRLQGAGSTDYGLVSLMPTPELAAPMMDADGRETHFDKASESTTPGYYAVTLDRGLIRVELAATPRVAHHRYRFAAGAPLGHVIVDLSHHLDAGQILDSAINLRPAEGRFDGFVRAKGRMTGGFGGFTLYFAGLARKPWISSQTRIGDTLTEGGVVAGGARAGAVLTFDTQGGAPVELALGLSFVSVDGARANLDAEAPTVDFDAARARARATWESLLGRVKVTGGSEAERGRFYTALAQAHLMPSIQSDVDGRYRGFDGAVHTADDFEYVSDLSLWDTYRTTHPLYTLVSPERARDAARSLVEMARQSGRLPKWPCATGDTGSMIGAPAEIVLAETWLRGVRDFDVSAFYAIARAAALDATAPAAGRGGRDNFETYARLGYVTAEDDGSVSRTGEYALADFALGNLARALGREEDARRLLARATGYRKLFDPATGFMRARAGDGRFTEPFDPNEMTRPEYVEANAWQSTWLGTHDYEAFEALFGGAAGLVAKLSTFFESAKRYEDETQPGDMVRALLPRPFYWHGNEPDIHAAYLFTLAGRPDLTSDWVRWIRRTYYPLRADGLPGNDDGGTLSSWFALSALGLYPVSGSDRLILGVPLFPKARVAMPGGELTIEAVGLSDANVYVQSVALDGAPVRAVTLPQSALGPGNHLVFTMGPTPGPWGRR